MFASSSILMMKIVLMSCGVVSLAIAVNYSLIPLIIHYLPTLLSVLFLMFKPPYLYLLLNGIILVIAAMSRFTQNTHTEILSPPSSLIPATRAIAPLSETWDEKMPVVVNGMEVGGEGVVEEEKEEVVVEEEEEEEEVKDIILSAMEKVEGLTSFGGRKKSKLSHEGRSISSNNMRVAKHKRHETLDSTWRMITEGRNINNTNNTFPNLDDENHTDNINSSVRQNSFFRKSATFKDRTNVLHEPPRSSGILFRKEPSLGKEELNLRVEAFIKKFNEDMRLERQESLQRYMEMVNRGG